MSNDQLKPIKINPELLTVRPNTNKNKTLKKSKPPVKPNVLKKDLLQRIKTYRSNHEQDVKKEDNTDTNTISNPKLEPLPITVVNDAANTSSKTNEVDDDFSQSINFLKNLSQKKKRHSKVTEDFPLTLDNNTIPSTNEAPPYSCLKNSNLPTFREWQNKTLKNNNNENNDDKNDNIPIEKTKSNRSITFKHNLGKKNRKVSVLIKNASTRKKILQEHSRLRETTLPDMKNYLKRHNLLKSGSNAPPDIIKKIYEQALLGGDIRNANRKSLVHNYLTD